MENVVIIGSGPAGLTAAIYAARAELSPVLYEGMVPGGQLIVSNEVENYPGFPETLSGAELIDCFRKQAERFGTKIITEEVQKIEKNGMVFTVHTPSGAVQAKSLIAATGAVARRLPIPSEKKFYGRGVSGCATCDGAFFRDKHVLVVGGGNTAMEDAIFLTRFAAKVTIVHRRDYFRAAPIEVKKARKNPKIEWKIPRVLEEITGDQTVSGALLRNPETGETEEISCDGIFVAIGHDPQTEIFTGLAECDQHGFIITEERSTRTSTPGFFACGDVMDPVYKQAVTAAGTGCMAALDAQKYLESSEE
jgi:thioredoxin reductase (NADPH)